MEQDAPRSNERHIETRKHVIDITGSGDSLHVRAAMTEAEAQRTPTRMHVELRTEPYTGEELAEMTDADERADAESFNADPFAYHKEDYYEQTKKIREGQDSIRELCDEAARSLIEGEGRSEDAGRKLAAVSEVVSSAAHTTPGLFDSLPQEVKDTVDLCGRIDMVNAILAGSSETTSLDAVYSDEQKETLTKDYFSALEEGVKEVIGQDGIKAQVDFTLPDNMRAINRSWDLACAVLEEIYKGVKPVDVLSKTDEVIKVALVHFLAPHQEK